MTEKPEVVHLTNDSTGRWGLTSMSGSYLVLDLDARTLTRQPSKPDDTQTAGTTMLRRDGETVALISIAGIGVRVLDEAIFVISLGLPDGRLTIRKTTPILVIERLDDAPAEGVVSL